VRRPGAVAAYGVPALAATYRLGASAGATFGGTVEATGTTQTGELEGDLRLAQGAVHLGAGGSSRRGAGGAAFDAALALGSDPMSLGASVLYRGPTFAQIDTSEPLGFTPPSLSTNVTLNRSFRSDAAIALSASLAMYRNETPNQTSYGATGSLPLGRNSELVVALATTRAAGSRPSSTFYASLVRTLRPGVTLATTATGGTSGVAATTEVRGDPPSASTGVGYDVRVGAGHGDEAEAIVTDHAPFADLESDAVMAPAGLAETLTLSGGVAAVAHHAFFTKPIQNGFALVDTGGIPGLPVLVDNHPAGYTDRAGYLLVNTLNDNAPNRIAVDSTKVPLDVELKHSVSGRLAELSRRRRRSR